MSILMNINTKKTHTSEVRNRDWTATLQQFAKDGSGLKARSLVSRKQPLGISPVPMAGVDYIQAVGESRCHRQLRLRVVRCQPVRAARQNTAARSGLTSGNRSKEETA